MDRKGIAELQELCRRFRIDVIKQLYEIQSGHPGGSLSVCEILTALYFESANINPSNYKDPKRDRIVLTKGHAAPMLYRVLAEKGFFPVAEMDTLRRINSRLQGHPASFGHGDIGIELSTGPLGIGLSASVGMALANRLDGINSYIYAIMGDGELNEGGVWEALMSAVKFNLNRIIVIVDNNGLQLDGYTKDVMPMGNLRKKFEAFGCIVDECDGHDLEQLIDTINKAKARNEGPPTVIVANTIKGKGVSFMEGNYIWHGGTINKEQYTIAMAELGGK